MRYNPALDGIRAFAVLAVVVFHRHYFPGGYQGVDVFFVLSGYLITSLLLVDLNRFSRIRLGRFYLRRLLRLYPPLIVALVVLAPLGFIAAKGAHQGYLLGNLLAATYTTDLYATVTGDWIGPWAHTWTLALEEQFYLIWPLLLLLGWRYLIRANPWAVVILLGSGVASIAGGVATSTGDGLTYNPIFNSGALIFGCVLALTQSRWASLAPRAAIGAAGIILLAGAWVLGGFPGSTPWAAPVSIAASVLLVAHLATGGTLSRVLSTRVLVFLGVISYELYLWHFAVIVDMDRLTPGPAALPFRIAAGVVVPFVGAYLSHRFVSAPLNRWLKPKIEARTG